MKIISSPRDIYQQIAGLKRKGKTVGFVATMGALHQGHLSLIQRARKDNDFVVVSIFVNPTQFGPREDLAKYPRPKERDLALCKKSGVDFIFYPKSSQMYPAGFRTFVSVEGLSRVLCGKNRPLHFKGVATVVAKLFNIVQPDIAYFGQKDCQQAVIIRQMAEDLNFPLKIKVLPTVREPDGLAMSSRNIYLNSRERTQALVLAESLKLAKRLITGGAKDTQKIISSMKNLIKSKPLAKIDYVTIVDLENLKPLKKITAPCLIALAVRIGKTRLIDNMVV